LAFGFSDGEKPCDSLLDTDVSVSVGVHLEECGLVFLFIEGTAVLGNSCAEELTSFVLVEAVISVGVVLGEGSLALGSDLVLGWHNIFFCFNYNSLLLAGF